MSGWRKIKLSEVLTHRKEFITIEDSIEYKRCRVQVNRKGVVLRDIVKGLEINTKKQQVCRNGDFLVAEIDAKVGGYGFVPDELRGAIVSSHYFLFEVDSKKMLPDYLRVIIKTDIIQNQINAKGSTNYSAIRPKNVLDFEIPFVDIEEQKLIIARVLNTEQNFSSITSELTTQQTLITQLRQSILQEAVQGKLVKQNKNDEPASELLKRIKAEKEKLIKEGRLKKERPLPPISENEIPYQLPEAWIWCKLKEACLLITDGKHGDSQNEINSGYYFLSAKDIQKGQLLYDYARQITYKDFEEVHNRTNLEAGDICIVNTGGTVGKMAIAPDSPLTSKTTFQKSVAVIKVVKKFIENLYIEIILRGATSKLIKVSGGSAINNLLIGDLNNLLIPLPPLSEQKRIIEKVNQLMQHCYELEQQVQQSITHAQQLMQAVLREVFERKEKKYAEQTEKLSIAAEP